jgi:hypothetical protein
MPPALRHEKPPAVSRCRPRFVLAAVEPAAGDHRSRHAPKTSHLIRLQPLEDEIPSTPRPPIRDRPSYTQRSSSHRTQLSSLSRSAPATVLPNHPGTFHKWRIMAHVLIMAAFQLRHPVTFLIQMKSSDLSLRVASHHLRLALWLILCDCYQAATADGSGRMSPMPGIRRAHPV